jgi:hypothetical protein
MTREWVALEIDELRLVRGGMPDPGGELGDGGDAGDIDPSDPEGLKLPGKRKPPIIKL